MRVAALKGVSNARDPRNPLARAHAHLYAALDDADPDSVGWMPAHLTDKDMERGDARKSDGSLVTLAEA